MLTDYQIYEKNPELSGTWYENRYPGQVVVSIFGNRSQWALLTDKRKMRLRRSGAQLHVLF